MILGEGSPFTISVVIPVLNECLILPQTLDSLQGGQTEEVIVVDGGSKDSTVSVARSWGVKVLETEAGRAYQMNEGARLAQGEVLLFLHGDTRLPPDFHRWIGESLAQPGVVGGAFSLKIDGEGLGFRWVEGGANWRSRFCQLPYGDQGIFLRRSIFEELGGFPLLPIMEDFVFMRQLQRLGRIEIVEGSVLTSARRWERLGIWKTLWLNQLMILGYFLGVSPTRLASWYRR